MLVISASTKKDKDATRMQAVQERFRMARKFLNPLYPIIVKGYGSRKGTVQSAFGRAMSHTLTNVIKGDYPDFRIEPALAKISNGMLLPLTIHTVSRQGNQIQLTWEAADATIKEYSQWDDEVILCAYDVVAGLAAINEHLVLRQDRQLRIDLPSMLHGQAVHLYLLLHDRDKMLYSRSQYLGLFA